MKYKKFICIVLLLVFSLSIKAQIFQDNLTGETAGQFPSKWELIKGGATVASINSVTAISFNNKSVITPKTGSKNYLPESFTLEFDAFFDAANKIHYNHDYQVRFWEGESYITFEGNNDFYYPIRIYRHGARIVGRLDGSSIKYEKLNRAMNVAEDLWRHITIDFNKGTLKVSVDNFIAIDISNYRFNPRMISIEAFFNAVGSKGAIKNIIIKGTPVVINNSPLDGIDSTQTSGDSTISTGNNNLRINDLIDGKSHISGTPLFLGVGAGENDNKSSSQNLGIGYKVLFNNNTGSYNTSVGHQSLYRNSEGGYNSAFGFRVLFTNTSGFNNTAIGNRSLYKNTNGNNNSAIGVDALLDNTTGNNNLAFGSNALKNNTTGNDNTVIGFQAGLGNIIGNGNIFIGKNSGYSEQGSNKLYVENSHADRNNALIYGEFDNKILRTNSQFQIGNPSTTGYAFPKVKGAVNQILQSDGRGNLVWVDKISEAIGIQKLNDLQDAKSHISGTPLFLGVGAGENDNSISYNLGIGYKALFNNSSGSNNTAVGHQTLYNNSEGESNVAVGRIVLFDNTTGNNNTAIGNMSLKNNTIGNNNTANGGRSLYANISGNENTATGYQALEKNNGNRNTAIGYMALYNNTTGNNNTAIGNLATVANATVSNQVRIGNNAITYAGIQVPWTVTSDIVWKEDVNSLPYGLDEVMLLKPVDYVRVNNENNTREMGFIAQDVEKMLSQIDYKDQGFLTKDDQGNLNLRYNDFIPLLTKAIQEQQEIIEQQKIKLQEQNNKYEQLLKRIEKLEKQNN